MMTDAPRPTGPAAGSHTGQAAPDRALDAGDVARIRRDFPALHQRVRDDRPLVYLDTAATALKPESVLAAMDDVHRRACGNIHRGVHWVSEEATRLYEGARGTVRRFINAASDNEIVFTSGTTASINLVAHSFGSLLDAGDEVVITWLEHHSNIVPWQLLAERRGIVLKVAPVDDTGALLMDDFARLLSPRTRLIAVTAVSNALGTVVPVAEIAALARGRGIPVLVDAAQAVPHARVDVRAWDIDFLAFSAHKLYGPSGAGVLWARRSWLDRMPPFLGGGDMIRSVSFEKTTYAPPPARFEAGTPNIAGVVGMAAAIDYVEAIGLDRISAYEAALLEYATGRLGGTGGVTLIGTAARKAAILSFTVEGAHPHDLGTILDQHGVAVRAGLHCAEPLMRRMGVPATARASLAFYNTPAEIDALCAAVTAARELFR